MADRLFTSSKADEILSALRFDTKLEKVVLSRIAFALSIEKYGKNVPKSGNYSGGELKRTTFNGEDETFLRTIIHCVYGESDIGEDEFFSNRSIIKNHIDNGALLLEQMYMECGRNPDSLFGSLAEKIGMLNVDENLGRGFEILVGKKINDGTAEKVRLNDTIHHANSHLAIMGKPGVGKTQLLLKILADIRIQSKFQTNFIYFDYKGDVVDNTRFIDVTKVQPYRLLQGSDSLPINPFILGSYDDQSINISAREKGESFSSINSRIGIVQKGILTDAIRTAYMNRRTQAVPYPDFQEVFEIARSTYKNEDKKDDSLIEVLKDLTNFDLFWKHGHGYPPIDKLVDQSLLIDLHALPVLKELVAYLVIERLYKEMTLLPDSSIQEGKRAIRTVLVIDEAHNYLNQRNLFLQRIIREGRSKGIVVFFASQSPADYLQDFFNFQELLEFVFLFQCESVTASSVQRILGCSYPTAKSLQSEIARLEPWQVVMRSSEKDEEYVKFISEAFYKSYA